MPVQVSYPGVYIQEIPSGVHSIVGVSTSAAAFVDIFKQGPVDHPTRVSSMGEFTRIFGGLDERSESSYGVSQFFLNGGQTAWIVRLNPAGAATAGVAVDGITFQAKSPGAWGNALEVAATATDDTVSIAVREIGTRAGQPVVVRSEVYHQLTSGPGPRNLRDVINHESELVEVTEVGTITAVQPEAGASGSTPRPFRASAVNTPSSAADDSDDAPAATVTFTPLTGGDDGLDGAPADGGAENGGGTKKGSSKKSEASGEADPLAARDAALATVAQLLSQPDDGSGTGMFALRKMAPEIFNLLCLPATAFMSTDDRKAIIAAGAEFCEEHRAFFVVDSPHDVKPTEFEESSAAELENLSANAAVWYPSLVIPDVINKNRPRAVASSGTMAGVIARTDTERGVWKAPAGTEAVLRGAEPQFAMTDAENGALNELGLNCLRTFPIYGAISWGARTLKGADAMASEWKYTPVRRTALHIENSLLAGTKWAVFEPNDEPLWAQLRLSVGTFMHDLFRQGAFSGPSARDAYFVNCDRTTTTQSDIDRGIVNIMVGFAPLKPAEFVIVNIEQIAGT